MEVVNLTENNNQDLIADLAAIVSSLMARVYGRQRAQCTTEQVAAALRAVEDGDATR
jgi:predicted site-specific integrase-resolvase